MRIHWYRNQATREIVSECAFSQRVFFELFQNIPGSMSTPNLDRQGQFNWELVYIDDEGKMTETFAFFDHHYPTSKSAVLSCSEYKEARNVVPFHFTKQRERGRLATYRPEKETRKAYAFVFNMKTGAPVLCTLLQ